MLGTGLGNSPAVRVRTSRTVRFASRTAQKSDPLSLGGPNLPQYPLTRGLCRVWPDPSVPISGSAFWDILCMVTVRFPDANRKILTLVCQCPFRMNRLLL